MCDVGGGHRFVGRRLSQDSCDLEDDAVTA